MDSEPVNDLTTAAGTSELEVPSELAHTDDFRSLCNEAPKGLLLSDLRGYEGLDWTRLKGYAVPQDDYRRESGVWRYGWRLWHIDSDSYYWLCKHCHRAKRTLKNTLKEPLYRATLATSGVIGHLKLYHKIDQKGSPQKKRKRDIDNPTGNGESEVAAIYNTIAASFDRNHFQALLYEWLISDNIAFNELDSHRLRAVFEYLNPRCKKEVIPSRKTASRTIACIYDKVRVLVKDTLKSAITSINFSFDLWTSNNQLALLGLCAHFINKEGKAVTSLLSLPRQHGRHSGANMADTISLIIEEYQLHDKLGYFTTDNASSNNTTLTLLGSKYGFQRDERWIRCSGHILNLVGQQALLGNEHLAFSATLDGLEEEEHQLLLWRRKGPIGKLHNLVYWINRSPQRCERFLELQRQYVTPFKPDDKQDTYQLVKDIETRWNSFYDSAERALYLHQAIDELMLEEQSKYDSNVSRSRRAVRSSQPKRPAILDDVLTVADWSVIKLYVEILKPLKDATMTLQGHIGGKQGAIWQVIPEYERLLAHFEGLKTRYPTTEELTQSDTATQLSIAAVFSQEHNDIAQLIAAVPDEQTTAEHHFAVNTKLAWLKLDQYYSKLDNTPIYVAGVVLHPRYKWRYLERAWQERPDWLVTAKSAFNNLLLRQQYSKDAALPSPPQYQPTFNDLEESEEDEPLQPDQQMNEYLRDRSYKHNVLVKDKEASPIGYWISVQYRWPQLAALALDKYSIPVMSDEPERVFSITGAVYYTTSEVVKKL